MKLKIAFVSVFFVLLASPLVGQVEATPVVTAPEIEVSADAWSWSSPDQARITFLLEGSGKNYEEATRVLNNKMQVIETAVRPLIGTEAVVLSRGDEYSPENPARAKAATENSAEGRQISLRRYLGIETAALDKVADVIDLALRSGASAMTETDFSVKRDESAKQLALSQATAKAKAKAEAVSRSLGVSLREVISVTVNEEPQAKVFREKRTLGEDMMGKYSDNDAHIFVTIRYAIAPSLGANSPTATVP